MKSYKAVVIDGRRLIRRAAALAALAVAATLVAVNIKIAAPSISVNEAKISRAMIAESVPVMAADFEAAVEFFEKTAKKAVSFLLTFDPWDARTAVFGEIPLVRAVSGGYLARLAAGDSVAAYNPQNADTGAGTPEPEQPSEGTYPITEVDSGQAKALGGSPSKILIRNETEYGINIEEMLNAPLKFNMSGSSPKVLIIHTHATECYSAEGQTEYSADKSDRSTDPTQNMIAVGEAVKRVFEDKGIAVLHDTTMHDYPSFNGSYANSLKTVEAYKSKYPDLAIVLDLHRDAFVYDDGRKAKFVTEIDGEKTAQLMLVVGTNAGGLDHPEWRENMKLALKLQSYISKRYPSLMRGVNLRKERFNGHTTYGSMIIEVGSSGNTLGEAVRGASLAAACCADYLKTLK